MGSGPTLYLLRRVPIVMLADNTRRSLYTPLVVPNERKNPEAWPDHQTIVAQLLCTAPDNDGFARMVVPREWLLLKETNRTHVMQVARNRALGTLREILEACQLTGDAEEYLPTPQILGDGHRDVWSLRALPVRSDLELLETAVAHVGRLCDDKLFLSAAEAWLHEVQPNIPVDLERVSGEPFRITAARWLPAKVRVPDRIFYPDQSWATGRTRAERVCGHDLLGVYRTLCDGLINSTTMGSSSEREQAMVVAAEIAQTIRHAGRKYSVARELLKLQQSSSSYPSFVGIQGGEIDCRISVNMLGATEVSRTVGLAVGRNDPHLARDLAQLVDQSTDDGNRLNAPPEVILMGLASYSAATAPVIDADMRSIAMRSEARVIVGNDAEMLLFTEHINGNGVVLIAETGSVVVARHRPRDGIGSKAIRLGGAEFVASDEGSAYQIARQALRLVLDAKDQITAGVSEGPDIEQLQTMAKALGARCHVPAFHGDLPTYLEQLATEVAKEMDWPKRRLAELASEILALAKAGNPLANDAVKMQARGLGTLLGRAIAWHVGQQSAVGAVSPPRLLLVGSVAHKQLVQRQMFTAVGDVLREDPRTKQRKALLGLYELGNPELIYVAKSAGDLLAQIAWDVGRVTSARRADDPAAAFPDVTPARRAALIDLLTTPDRTPGDWEADVARWSYSWQNRVGGYG